ncbi:S-adenosyl-L-methionine-dependent methyltransferase [Periconia macrospinosa]|uniref:S-adenosyl-L-methionine-dependent methyltransferase n=1 Tax=Periconia macrospinosa TaxID=97972 RepID=A0A2V1DHL1_9PLEO|nr:S-adenosyl-L-methionine-dependent methyltransferase [Periconia macrospinosa]
MSQMSSNEAEALVRQLEELSENPPPAIMENTELRRRFREASNAASLAVHWPSDSVHLIAYGSLYVSLARIGIDTKLFEVLAASSQPLTSEEIAQQTGIEIVLAKRLLRFYQSFRWIKQQDENQFIANNVTKALTPPFSVGVEFFNTVLGPPFTALPDYLRSHNYTSPTSAMDSPWQTGWQTTDHPFVWLQSHPEHSRLFMQWMPLERDGLPEFLDAFPFEKTIGQNTTDETVIFVDIGSALGSQSILVRDRFPNLKGKVVMQDQQHVVDAWAANKRSDIEAQVYNFFEPQPIKGARIYYMRNIIHDHHDDQAREILKNTVSAFDQDSILLIDDIVLPDSGIVPWRATIADFNMMSSLAAKERSESEWRTLIESAGLKVVEIYKYSAETGDSIVAARRA